MVIGFIQLLHYFWLQVTGACSACGPSTGRSGPWGDLTRCATRVRGRQKNTEKRGGGEKLVSNSHHSSSESESNMSRLLTTGAGDRRVARVRKAV